MKNASKLYEVCQNPDESPPAFFKHLCEMVRKWMDLDPDDKANKRTFNMWFIM